MVEETPGETPSPPAAPKPRRPRTPARSAPPPTPWERVKEHKVLQWSLAYLGAALALAHGQELLAHAFHWPELTGRLLMGGLILGFPIAIVLAWYHGHKGLTHISAGEMTALAVLLLAGGSVLTLMARAGHGDGEHESGVEVTGENAGKKTAAATVSDSAPVAASSTASGPSTPSKKVRIAIMPFENLSPDPANAFFTDGLQEEILSTLSQRAPDCEVISRTTMMTYRQHPKSISEVAKELGATHVIEGSVRREAQNVRLTLQLINARTDDHMWSRNYDRQLGSAMTLQTDVANEVAAQLALELANPGQQRQAITQDAEAYDLYLKGRLSLASLVIVAPLEEWRNAEDVLARAVKRDPSFGLAYVTRFDLRVLMYSFNIEDPDVLLQKMQGDLDAVRRLMPNTPALQSVEGLWSAMNHDYARALALLSAAETGGFADSETLRTKADVMGRMGLFEEALPVIAHAVELDPANTNMVAYQGIVFMYLRRPAEALKVFEQLKTRVPEAAPLAETLEAGTRYSFTGDTHAVEAMTERLQRLLGTGATVPQMSLAFLQRRYRDAHTLAKLMPARDRTPDIQLLLPYGVGDSPVRALALGQADLLLGDQRDAKVQGRAVLDFVASRRSNPRNEWFLKTHEAAGDVLIGDRAGAIAAARQSLTLMPRSRDAVNWAITAYLAACAYAWAGAEDDAVELLEQLSTAVPGVAPAEVTRSPAFTPLAKNARYQALVQKLEAQIAATKL